jgi:hypothetical protein
MGMKKLVCFLSCLSLVVLSAVAIAKPVTPKKPPYEYFAIAYIKSPGGAKDATIVVNYSEDGLTWNKPFHVPLKGKDANAVQGVDITNHNEGILQGFAHDYKSKELDRLFGRQYASGLKMDPPMPALPVAKVGSPATIILPDGNQLIACSIDGEVTVFKGKHDAATGFAKLKIPCGTFKAARPDIAFMRGKVLLAWRLPTKGIMTALYERDTLGRLKFVRCENPFYPGSIEIGSEPVLAASDEVFYMGLAVKKKGEKFPSFRIYRGANGTNWKDHAMLGEVKSPQVKLGLAAKYEGELLAAMVEKNTSGVKTSAWLYHRDPKLNWQWTALGDAPWDKVIPAFKDFGLDRGGVRR